MYLSFPPFLFKIYAAFDFISSIVLNSLKDATPSILLNFSCSCLSLFSRIFLVLLYKYSFCSTPFKNKTLAAFKFCFPAAFLLLYISLNNSPHILSIVMVTSKESWLLNISIEGLLTFLIPRSSSNNTAFSIKGL